MTKPINWLRPGEATVTSEGGAVRYWHPTEICRTIQEQENWIAEKINCAMQNAIMHGSEFLKDYGGKHQAKIILKQLGCRRKDDAA